MTTVPVGKLIWGPGSLQNWGSTPFSSLELNTATSGIVTALQIPRSGTITQIGVHIFSITGSPPDYNAGLVTLDGSGFPTTTQYGGSAYGTYSPASGTGFKWISLATPATVTKGDLVGVILRAGATPPNTSNYITVLIASTFNSHFPKMTRSSGASWIHTNYVVAYGIRYDDNSISGVPFSTAAFSAQNGTEKGAKFTLPLKMLCTGIVHCGTFVSNLSPVYRIRDASDNILATVTITDEDMMAGGNSTYVGYTEFPTPVWLEANQVYRATLTLSNVQYVRLHDSAEPGDFIPEGANWRYTLGPAGSWVETNTDIPKMGLVISAIEQPEAGGAAGAYGFVG